jgi:hypothetical protein
VDSTSDPPSAGVHRVNILHYRQLRYRLRWTRLCGEGSFAVPACAEPCWPCRLEASCTRRRFAGYFRHCSGQRAEVWSEISAESSIAASDLPVDVSTQRYRFVGLANSIASAAPLVHQ